MANTVVPQVRLHKASGQYVIEIGGKTRYLGRDEQAARREALPLLQAWRQEKGVHDGVTVLEAADALARYVMADTGHGNYRLAYAPLKRFVDQHGGKPIDAITIHDVEAFKIALQADCAPKTVNHWLGAAKRLLRYSAAKGWRTPLEMSFIKACALPCPPPKHLSIEELDGWLTKTKAYNSNLYNWVRLSSATAARPTETVRLVNKEGSWLEEGVFCLTVGKTNKTVKHPRCIAFSTGALKLYNACQQQWKWQCTYAQACHAAFESGPHRLRHTSAYLLHRLPGEKVSREDTDVLLGHYPNWVSLTYNPVDWRPVKALADRYFAYLQSAMPQHFPL